MHFPFLLLLLFFQIAQRAFNVVSTVDLQSDVPVMYFAWSVGFFGPVYNKVNVRLSVFVFIRARVFLRCIRVLIETTIVCNLH